MKTVSELEQFVMRLKSLHNIDGYLLEPEFDIEEQKKFVRDPVHYLFATTDAHRAVIWRELETRHQRNLALVMARAPEAGLPEGVTVVRLDDPAELHRAIGDAVGEPAHPVTDKQGFLLSPRNPYRFGEDKQSWTEGPEEEGAS